MAREISLLYPPSLVQTFFDKNLFLPPTFSFANLSIESTVSITVTQTFLTLVVCPRETRARVRRSAKEIGSIESSRRSENEKVLSIKSS